MKSTLIVGIGASLLTAGIAKAQQRQDITPRTPNILFIYADDLGYGDLECYDGTQVKTPNINRLAKNGIRFTNAHATASTSTPSRYSMLTGEYAWRRPGTDIAAGNAGMIIRPERYTIADMFKNAGYATAAIGKWHLGLGDKAGEQDWNAPLPTALGDLGFDYSYIMATGVYGIRIPEITEWGIRCSLERIFRLGVLSAPISYMGFRDIRVLIHIQITLRRIIRSMRAGE